MIAAAPLPHPCLVADVGGTNARFAIVATPDAPPSPMLRLPTGRHGEFADTVREAIREGGFPRPRCLLMAAAGPVAERAVTLTNSTTPDGRLAIDGPRLAAALALEQGLLLNDFEALSLSLPFLAQADLLPIGGGVAVPGGTVLVVGPGTGLGVGALLAGEGRLTPVASEGGHVGLGPETAEDLKLWTHLTDGRIAAEDIISGRGLARLHAGLAAMRGGAPAFADAAALTAAAQAGDPAATETVDTFVRLLGRFAGDMALAFAATGGVFIGGGIAPRFRAAMAAGGFRAAFEAKGPQSDYLQAIPTTLVTADSAALCGLAAVAAEPQRFVLDYASRFWR